MVKEKEKTEDKVGLVSITGEIGMGLRMPDGTVVELNNVDVGTAQVLAYLVESIADIKKNL